MIEEGEKENERSEATTTRQRIEERVLLVRFDAHDVTIIEWRCNFSILGAFGTLSQIDYSVIGPIYDSSRLRCLTFSHATATSNERARVPFPSKFLFIASNGLAVAGTRPNRRKMDVSRGNSLSPERITGDFDNSIFSAREKR